MISWIIILSGSAASFYFTDLHSEERFYSYFAPVMYIFFSIAFFIKLLLTFEWARDRHSSASGFGDGGGSGDGGGGDGGSC